MGETLAAAAPPAARLRPALRRLLVALGAGIVLLLAMSASTGLLTGHPVGAADNGDGYRLYCGAGLLPDTPSRFANWKGGVVLRFLHVQPCHNPIPSSAAVVLRVAVHGTTGVWSLTVLGWWYVAMAAVVAALATWAALRRGPARALILLPAVIPMIEPDFVRFFLSTYSEPAGLVGAFAFLCGLGVLMVTRRTDRAERWLGLILVAGGGFVVATAKTGYLPLLGVALAVCACSSVTLRSGWRGMDRVGPIVLAAATLLISIAPLHNASAWQAKVYPGVNAHDLIYTVDLEVVPHATRDLGLPGAAQAYAGRSYFTNATDVPGDAQIKRDPGRAQWAAIQLLAEHPADLFRIIGIAMQATEGRALTYLPSNPLTRRSVPIRLNTIFGEQGATASTFGAWLNRLPLPWWPSLVALLGLAAAGVGWLRRGSWSAYTSIAGLTAGTAVVLAAAAVLGDGYFELPKHVWLAAYCVDATVVALAGAAISAVTTYLRARRAGNPA